MTSTTDSASVVALAGDWDANARWAVARLTELGERGITSVLHVGDFLTATDSGGAGHKPFLLAVEKVCASHGIDLVVTPGNHEPWPRFVSRWEGKKGRAEDGTLLPIHLTDHVVVLPRGHRWESGGRTLCSFGGAASINFEDLTRGVEWWPEHEMATQEDVDRVVAAGPVDVLVTHDSPSAAFATPKVADILDRNPLGWSSLALSYAAVSARRVTDVMRAVTPRALVHGHHHVASGHTVHLEGADHETMIWSMAAAGSAGNIRLLDLATMSDPPR